MKPKDKLSWTDDRIALLKRMWKEGKSAADIAKALGKGVTRNAVIGKAHRMGLSGRPAPVKKSVEIKKAPPKAAPKIQAKETKPAVKPGKSVAPVKAAPVKPVLPAKAAPANAARPPAREVEPPRRMEKEAIPPGGGVALIDLSERMCKWPIGDPREPDFTFCGRAIRPGTPYCPEHAAAAYQSLSRRGPILAPVVADKDDEEEDDAPEAEAEEDDEVEAV